MAHGFCRSLLTSVMGTVREHTTAKQRKDVWAIRTSDGQVEFHGPDNFYWHGQGCCLWYARSQGWSSWLKTQGKEVIPNA